MCPPNCFLTPSAECHPSALFPALELCFCWSHLICLPVPHLWPFLRAPPVATDRFSWVTGRAWGQWRRTSLESRNTTCALWANQIAVPERDSSCLLLPRTICCHFVIYWHLLGCKCDYVIALGLMASKTETDIFIWTHYTQSKRIWIMVEFASCKLDKWSSASWNIINKTLWFPHSVLCLLRTLCSNIIYSAVEFSPRCSCLEFQTGSLLINKVKKVTVMHWLWIHISALCSILHTFNKYLKQNCVVLWALDIP